MFVCPRWSGRWRSAPARLTLHLGQQVWEKHKTQLASMLSALQVNCWLHEHGAFSLICRFDVSIKNNLIPGHLGYGRKIKKHKLASRVCRMASKLPNSLGHFKLPLNMHSRNLKYLLKEHLVLENLDLFESIWIKLLLPFFRFWPNFSLQFKFVSTIYSF